ncbi:MAG: ATP phosphoribosyltransferase regulatory subunit [Lachnospiraceae bacterium]
MKKKLLHTPEGVRDLYYQECAQKETLEEQIKSLLKLFGFRQIRTPMFEYFDVFNKETGSAISKEMFKFTDRDGNTLVLRPDMTPPVARCTAKYFMEEDMPIRLFYAGETFKNNNSYQGRLKEITQIGAELINDATSDADAEMIALLANCLKKVGLKEFQIELGHIDIIEGLMEEAQLSEDEKEEMTRMMVVKNFFGMEEIVQKKVISTELKHALIEIPQMFGDLEQLEKALEMVKNEKSRAALLHLQKLYGLLEVYGLEKYVTFELGMVSQYRYYTGIIFRAYTYGTGEAIAAGGRYDTLISQYGKESPSIGFAILVDSLMAAMRRQDINIDTDIMGTILLYDRKQKVLALQLANQLRNTGTSLQVMKKYHEKSLSDYMEYARRSYVGGLLYIDETGETVQVIATDTGASSVVSLKDLLD